MVGFDSKLSFLMDAAWEVPGLSCFLFVDSVLVFLVILFRTEIEKKNNNVQKLVSDS